ncbi:MAG: right-handed parallel beta-helix repeat-containing protein [Cyanobacteria bacterium P01_E01_bin.42]
MFVTPLLLSPSWEGVGGWVFLGYWYNDRGVLPSRAFFATFMLTANELSCRVPLNVLPNFYPRYGIVNKLLSFGCSGIIAFSCFTPALAEPLETKIAQTRPSTSTSARDLAIESRMGGGVSTSGSGTPRFSFLEGFTPLLQTPGESILFLEGRLSWLDYERVGTNLILGHRLFDRSGDRVLGGYISYDSQDTGNHRFNQIGFGFERLGEDWDLRFNGYIPIGENRQQVGSVVSTTSNSSITSFGFQGNSLVFSGTQTREDRTQYEAAMLAIDGEAGGKLLDIRDFGQVRGYGGLYYLNATNSTALGWRARLEARGLDNYRLGLGVQHDAVFGTNFTFNFGVSFGGSSKRGQDENLLARMGDFVTRNHIIIVDEQTEISTSSETFSDVIATNPVTGEPWFFQHISNTESSGGDGTFENPFGTIVEGTVAANTNSTDNQNEIVYVQFGSNITNATAITIPDSVQLLSIAPTQTIETQLGTLQLPSSGVGTSQRPQINATVTMGNNSVLSGFNLTNITGDAITANNVSGFTIEESAISSITGNGLSANNSSNFTLTNMPFSNITQDGISVTNGSNNITIGNNTFNTVGQDGISAQNTTSVTVSGNTFNNITGNGISDSSSTGLTLSDNTFNTVGQNGISASSSTGLTVSNNTFDTITQNGIFAENSTGFKIQGNTISNITSTNTTNLKEGNGIFAENSTGFTIEDNTISDTTKYGIRAGVDNGSTIGNIVIQNNTLSNIGGGSSAGTLQYDGIFVGASSISTITDVTISGNTISGVDNDGIAVGSSNNSTFSLAIITGNNVSNVGRFGIGVGVDTPGGGSVSSSGSTVANAAITNNSITDAGQSSVFSPPTNIVPGASVGVAIESTSSHVCFNLSNNTSINPNNAVVTANLDLYLQKTVSGISAANFNIVNRDTINSNNTQFETVTIFDPLVTLTASTLTASATDATPSCP